MKQGKFQLFKEGLERSEGYFILSARISKQYLNDRVSYGKVWHRSKWFTNLRKKGSKRTFPLFFLLIMIYPMKYNNAIFTRSSLSSAIDKNFSLTSNRSTLSMYKKFLWAKLRLKLCFSAKLFFDGSSSHHNPVNKVCSLMEYLTGMPLTTGHHWLSLM